jgi:hypothetical protein
MRRGSNDRNMVRIQKICVMIIHLFDGSLDTIGATANPTFFNSHEFEILISHADRSARSSSHDQTWTEVKVLHSYLLTREVPTQAL